ncbi:hypothetical protein Vadar_003785 [Vaccinium darrowii]|uniref:Uncharacterized protein n=1 Tax=Vaccinium darrowii TaxID=229202 RepID=A0ACB7XF76_9ERIC|nr:hypothetical protein Vadar_003785 [Vaccinium darrowii]
MDTELVLEEVAESEEDFSDFCLLGKILSQRNLNKQGVSNIINLAWKTKESFSISPWKDNTYLFRFKSIPDKELVLRKGPWSVMNHLLILKEARIGVTMEEIDFSLCPFWVQVHGLPISCLTKTNATKIGKLFADLLDVEGVEDSGGLILSRSFLRIKVLVDTSKPLLRGFFQKRSSSEWKNTSQNLWINFKYERLSDFCYNCGRLGHDRSSCKFPPEPVVGGSSYGPDLKTATIRDLRSAAPKEEDNLQALPEKRLGNLNREVSDSEASASTARVIGVQERVVDSTNIPNLVVSDTSTVRDLLRIPRGGLPEEHDEGESGWKFTPSSSSKGSIPHGFGLSINTKLSENPAQQQTHPSSPSYFVTEPESPKGELVVNKPMAYNKPILDSPSSGIISNDQSPVSSPKSTKQKALVDIILAHVFDDLTLKRKAPNDLSEDEKRSKLQKALK